MRDPDVLVIGSGPGGCSAALEAASAGFDVTLLEAQRFPRQRPGETLHPGIEPLLARLGAADLLRNANYRRHTGTWVRWRGPLSFQPFGGDASDPWRGYQAPGDDFDARLRDAAVRRGVNVTQGVAVAGVRAEDAASIHVKTSAGGITPRVVVDATGRRHWLARQLGIPIERHSPRILAAFGYTRGAARSFAREPLLVSEPGGWTWIARIDDEVHHWTRVRIGSRRPSRRTPAALTPCQGSERLGGADVTWRSVSEPAGLGYFIVGDAAAILDPASSHGVLRAVMSGMNAGFLTVRLLRGEIPAAAAAATYSQWLRHWVQSDMRRIDALYAGAARFGPTWRAAPRSATRGTQPET